jgi:hypothetical protein
MSKTYKRADIRRPITVEILADIIRILPQICNSTYEAKLFSAVFVLAFHAFLRIGETVESSKSYHVIQKRDVILNHTDISVSVTINSSKTDQYGLKTKLVLNSEFVSLTHFCCLRCSHYAERMCVIVILIITQKSQCRFKNNSYLISSNLLMIEMTKE